MSNGRPFAALRAYWRGLSSVSRGFFAQAILFAIWIAVIGLVTVRLVDEAGILWPHASNSWAIVTIAIVMLLCALPKVLLFLLAILVNRGVNRRRFTVDPARVGTSYLLRQCIDDPNTKPAIEDARTLWAFEEEELDNVFLDRLLQHAGLYGFFASLALSMSAGVIVVHVFRDVATRSEPGMQFDDGDPARIIAALAGAVGAATAVIVMRDIGRIVLRASQRDLSAQMLAWSTKRLAAMIMFAMLAAGMWVAIPRTFGTSLPGGEGHWGYAVLIGSLVALLGERAATAITERAASALGMPVVTRTTLDLTDLDGLSDEDAWRLGEEGIDSIQGLAFFSTPRLYLLTKYSLQRICEWQDQALLMTRVGAQRAKIFSDQLQITTATQARNLALFLLRQPRDASWDDTRKLLGFATDGQAEALFRRLAEDDLIVRLAIHRTVVPDLIPNGNVLSVSGAPTTP